MAIPILNHLDGNSCAELRNFILHKTTSGSASNVEGKIIYDTGSDTIKYYDGSSWINLSGSTSISGNNYASDLKIGRDADNLIDFTTDNEITFRVGGNDELRLDGGDLSPETSDGLALGTASLMWSDLFLASGAVINFNNSDVTLTHSSNTVTVAGGTWATAALTASTGTFSGVLKTDDTTDATSTTDGSLQTDGGLSVAKDAIIGNDVYLLTDSSVLGLGAGKDATLTHDGTTGLTIAATPISIDSTGELHLNSTTGDIKLQDGGADQIAFDLDGTAGEVIMKPAVDSDDLVFQQYDATEVIRVEDDGSLGLVGNKLNIANSSSDVVIKPLTDAKDIIFQQYDGTTVLTIEDNATANIPAGKLALGGTAVTSTAAELNLLDTAAANTVVNSKAVIYGSSGELAGTLSTASQTNVTGVGTISTGTWAATDVAIAHGGTGQSTAAAAANALLNVSQGGALSIGDGSDTITIPGSLVVTGDTTYHNETIRVVDNNTLQFEGATADSYELNLTTADIASSDKTVTLADLTGHVALFAVAPTATISSTPAELNILDGATVVVGEINYLDLGSTAVGTAIASKAVVLDANKDYTGLRNFTITGELDAATLDISGDADIDGTLETDALSIDGTTITTTAAEINLIDGGTARGTTALADGDGLLVNDGGTMRMTNVTTVASYMAEEGASLREKVFVLNDSVTGVASSDNITYVVTHSLNSRNVMVEVIRNGSNSGDYATVWTDVTRTGDDAITIVFCSAVTAGDYTCMIRKIG